MKRMRKAPNQGRFKGWRRKLQCSLNELVMMPPVADREGPHDNRETRRSCMRCSIRPERLNRNFVGVIQVWLCDLHQRMAEAGR